jgi:hypothetical protein
LAALTAHSRHACNRTNILNLFNRTPKADGFPARDL